MIEIVYRKVKYPVIGEKPYGIRDNGGFLLFFPDIQYYHGQDDRFVQELRELHDLANYLKDLLIDKYREDEERDIIEQATREDMQYEN